MKSRQVPLVNSADGCTLMPCENAKVWISKDGGKASLRDSKEPLTYDYSDGKAELIVPLSAVDTDADYIIVYMDEKDALPSAGIIDAQ